MDGAMSRRIDEPMRIDDLLQRARDGDGQAENILFGRIHARVLAVAKRKIWDPETAEDLAQDATRTILEKYRTSEMPGGLIAWTLTILHNKIGNYLKHREVERRVIREEGRNTPKDDLIADAHAQVEHEVDARRLADALEEGLRLASTECRRILRLLLEGASRAEIQSALGGVPMGTIDARISRCRAKLLAWVERRMGETA